MSVNKSTLQPGDIVMVRAQVTRPDLTGVWIGGVHVSVLDIVSVEARPINVASRLRELADDIMSEARMRQWDSWRRYIAGGGSGSWPRDAFEALRDLCADELRAAADEIELLKAEIATLRGEWHATENH